MSAGPSQEEWAALCRTGEIRYRRLAATAAPSHCRRDELWDAAFCAELWRLVLEPANWPEGRAQRLQLVVATVLAAPEAETDLVFASVDDRTARSLVTLAGADGSVAMGLLAAVYRHRLDLRPTVRGLLGEVRLR